VAERRADILVPRSKRQVDRSETTDRRPAEDDVRETARQCEDDWGVVRSIDKAMGQRRFEDERAALATVASLLLILTTAQGIRMYVCY
jgi:hypothetical protein